MFELGIVTFNIRKLSWSEALLACEQNWEAICFFTADHF